MFSKNMKFIIIIMIGFNPVMIAESTINELWSNPIGELWVDIFTEERDRDFDSFIDTAVVYHGALKANEAIDEDISYSWNLEVFYLNASSLQPHSSIDNWVLMKNSSQTITIEAGASYQGSTRFITVPSSGTIQINILLNINQSNENKFNCTSTVLNEFNQTLRDFELERNPELEPPNSLFFNRQQLGITIMTKN